MSYKIAVASSDGKNVDVSFGGAEQFLIYEVEEEKSYHLLEVRDWKPESMDGLTPDCKGVDCRGEGNGCGGAGSNIPKLSLVEDCRCLICKKIGFQVCKQLEKKAITAFDIDCDVEEALSKITLYFDRVDHHRTLRGISNGGEEE